MSPSALARLALVFAVTAILVPAPARSADAWRATVDPRVLEAIETATIDVVVVLAEQSDLDKATLGVDRDGRGRAAAAALRATAARTQPGLLAALDAAGIAYRPFWILNALAVPEADAAAVALLAAHPAVARIEADLFMPLVSAPADPRPVPAEAVRTAPWNVAQIGAPAVWADGNTGQDAVVGILDTGCDWTHPAVHDQYRGWDGASADHDYNWHDAIHDSGGDSPVPVDADGHGTHILGTAVGDDGSGMQIGVAPGARWIACRSIINGWSSPSILLEGFEWMFAPAPVGGGEGDPERAPDVITTAWYCPPSVGCAWGTLLPAVAALRAAGIVIVATAGGAGPGCGTILYPPEVYDESYTIGSTGPGDLIAVFSGRGPVVSEQGTLIKPDLTAPGVDILSCVPGGTYSYWSGTAMAVAHVAGAVALAVTAHPALAGQPDAIEARLNATAVPQTSSQCGDGDAVPNSVYGHGRVDVEAACAAVTEAPAGAETAARLLPSAPNPFNPRTTLVYEVGRTGAVDLRIYDASGRLVRVLVSERVQARGRYEVGWDGRDGRGQEVPTGVYLSRLSAGGEPVTGRLLLLR